MNRYGVIMVMLAVSAMAAGQTPGKLESRPALSAADQQEVQALADDVARLRSLVRQMEMNLALVQTTQTPLKHQFDLEVEAWRLVLDGMDRRLQRLRGTSTGGVVLPGTVPLRQDSRQGRP